MGNTRSSHTARLELTTPPRHRMRQSARSRSRWLASLPNNLSTSRARKQRKHGVLSLQVKSQRSPTIPISCSSDGHGPLDMSPLKRPSEDAEHEDGRRPAPRTPRIRACKSMDAPHFIIASLFFLQCVVVGAECKRHKIKCEPVDNEAKCAKCLRSGTECVPYNLNQRLLDEDAA